MRLFRVLAHGVRISYDFSRTSDIPFVSVTRIIWPGYRGATRFVRFASAARTGDNVRPLDSRRMMRILFARVGHCRVGRAGDTGRILIGVCGANNHRADHRGNIFRPTVRQTK